ncbi:MAG: hypothetical protein ACFB01_02815 [Cohaesibacteraceae bacterium]
MGFRTKPHIEQAIQRAAALSGVDDGVFTTKAASVGFGDDRIARTHQFAT